MPDRAGSWPLTAALLRPLGHDRHSVSATEIERLSAELTTLVAHRPGGGPFRLTDYVVRSALWPPEYPLPQTPFAWSTRTARRSLGLASVRALLAGSAHSPVEGVGHAVRQAVRRIGQGLRPASSMDQWLAGLSAAGRAAVEADAVTWATRLWSGLEWGDFATPPTIGRDHWWDSPHSSLLALRSRAEVRSSTADGRGNPVSVHLVVLGGPRRTTIRSELSVVALVEVLRRREPLLPGRIVGWWPDSGRFVSVDVDQVTLSEGVATLARTVASLEATLEASREASRSRAGVATGAAA